MRVLLITDWTANEGGIEVYVTRASQGLRAAGHEVRLLTSSIGSIGRHVPDYVAYASDNPAAQVVLQITNPFAVARVRAALQEFRPDVVQVNMFEKYLSPGIFRALQVVPTVVFVHYYKPICPTALKLLPDGALCHAPAGLVCLRSRCVGVAEWLRDRPRYGLIRSGLAGADRVLACSHWMVEQLRVNGIAAQSVALPVPAPGRHFVRAPSPEPLFAYCGRLDQAKGVDLLLHAFGVVHASRPAARLHVLGDGARRDLLERLAHQLGIAGAVQFRGHVDFAVVEATLARSWALVAPSVWPEPLGLVAIEAITRGVPAITSAYGGFAETVEPGLSGFLVPNGDRGALAECLISAVDRGPMAIPEHAIRLLQHRHDADRHTATLVGIFGQAIASRQRHPA